MITGNKLAKKVDTEFPKPKRTKREDKASLKNTSNGESEAPSKSHLAKWLLPVLLLVVAGITFGICWLVYYKIEH